MTWTPVEKPCVVCGTQFISHSARGKYCSDKCRRGEEVCIECGTIFLRKGNTSGCYCSIDCWYNAKVPVPGRNVPKPCPQCGGTFKPMQADQKFCSSACGHASRRSAKRPTICLRCGGAMPAKAHIRSRFCSRTCSVVHHNVNRPNLFRRALDGAKRTTKVGYIEVKDGEGWILEHRLVMGATLGRSLRRNEHVHHRDGVKSNNAPSNLELWSNPHPRGQRVKEMVEDVLRQPEILALEGSCQKAIETAIRRIFAL